VTGDSPSEPGPHRRRPRYSGKYPRRFEEKYKEHNPEQYADTVAKVLASGKTPAGTHRPIMVQEILEVLAPQPAEVAVDCTLGYGGHAQEILPRIQPGGRLLGLDVDPNELPKTEARLRALGFGPDAVTTHRTNFAGLPKILADANLTGVDIVLADLGVSSMQLDDPSRGFSTKFDGPLDMRMNPQRGQPAFELLARLSPDQLAKLFHELSDEPNAPQIASVLAGKRLKTTAELVGVIRKTLPRATKDELDLTLRRVFQALRIAVNDELSALDSLLRCLPTVLNPNGRVAILTFHSGEDRRVKKAFAAGLRDGIYSEISPDVIRTSSAERHANPRSAPAKLRWARRSREAQ
jgi:16S rRNA (cytosine1402-N4)-methyltransferase